MSRDRATLLDIVIASRDIIDCTDGVHRDEFLENRVLQSAVLHKLMLMGEAVKRLSGETRNQHPEIPWKDIAGLRDKLIHAYGEVDPGLIWDIVRTRLSELLTQVEALVTNELDV